MKKYWVGLCLGFLVIFLGSLITAQAQPTCSPSRLSPSQLARVTPGSANRMRAEATTSSRLIMDIPAGDRFRVFKTDICAEGYLWVGMVYGGNVGYTVEAEGDNYFVESLPLAEGAIAIGAKALAWSPDGHTLAISTYHDMPSIDLFDTNDSSLSTFTDTDSMDGLAFSPTNPDILAATAAYGVLRVRNIKTQELLFENIQGDPMGGIVSNITGSLQFSPDGSQLFVLESDGAYFYDTLTWVRKGSFFVTDPSMPVDETHLIAGQAVTTSDIQQLAVTIQYPQMLFVMDRTGARTPLDYTEEENKTIWTLAFSPDSTMLAVSNNQGQVDRYNLVTGEHLTYRVPFEGDYYFIRQLSWSPDSKLLALGESNGWDETSQAVVRLLDPVNMQEVGLVTPENAFTVTSLAFSPDGTQLAVGFDQRFIMIYNTADLR